MRYESLSDDQPHPRPQSGNPRTPAANLPLLSPSNVSPVVSPSSSSVGRIRLSSAILGLLGVLTGAVLMFLIAALRRHISRGGGTHVINPHPGYSPVPPSLESLEKRAMWMSGRTLAPLHVMRARLDKAAKLLDQQDQHWHNSNCSIGNPALDAFAGVARYQNSTLSVSAAAARFLGTDFAIEYSPNEEDDADFRADNFGFDMGGIAPPAQPTESDVKSVLTDDNGLPPPAVFANTVAAATTPAGYPRRLEVEVPSSAVSAVGGFMEDSAGGGAPLDGEEPQRRVEGAGSSGSQNNDNTNEMEEYRSRAGMADPSRMSAGLWSYLFPAGLFNRFRRRNPPVWQVNGAVNESSVFYSNATLLPGMEGVEDTEAVCLRGFTPFTASSCLGPPYLYVSYHGGRTDGRARAVCKFTRDGCALGVALMPSSLHALQHPRGLMLHGNFLFAAESDRDNSAILRYSHCNPALGNRRELLEVLVTGKEGDPDAGLVHPYGFAKDENGWLYVSAQDTFVVLRYDPITGQAAPLPPALQHVVLNDTSIEELIAIEDEEALEARDEKRERIRQRVMRKYRLRLSGHTYENFYNGTFVDLGTDGVRGIAVDGQGLLYVADKAKGLLVFDRDGYSLGQMPLNVRNPISVHYCADRNTIWVGSADSMALMEYDVVTWELTQSIQHREMVHPAGFITHGDSLYVISQRTNKLLRFSMITGLLEDVVLENLPDAGERLIISPC